MHTATITLNSLFDNPIPSHGDTTERRHNRLAITWIGVAIIVMIIASGLELWAIDHMVGSLMDELTKSLTQTQHHVTTAR